MWIQSWLPDTSKLPLFDWAENRDIQHEAYELWLRWYSWEGDVWKKVWAIISSKWTVSMPNEKEHSANSYIKDEEDIEIWYNFKHAWSCFRLIADIEIKNRRDWKNLFDISRVPYLKNIRYFKWYEDIGYREIEDTSFLDIHAIKSKASLFFLENHLWNNQLWKVA